MSSRDHHKMELFIFLALRIFPIFVNNFNNSVHNNIEICQIVDFVDIPVNFAKFYDFRTTRTCRCTTGEYNAVRLKSFRNPVESSAVNNSLISIQENGKLLWLRPPNGTPFKVNHVVAVAVSSPHFSYYRPVIFKQILVLANYII